MSYVLIEHNESIGIEVGVQCAECGEQLRSTVEALNPIRGVSVKVRPCARCQREAAEQINGASIHREGVRS